MHEFVAGRQMLWTKNPVDIASTPLRDTISRVYVSTSCAQYASTSLRTLKIEEPMSTFR